MTIIKVHKFEESNEAPLFQKDDLVLLKAGREHMQSYKNRPVIVTRDMNRGDRSFSGFCLVENESMDNFNAESFEFRTDASVTISN